LVQDYSCELSKDDLMNRHQEYLENPPIKRDELKEVGVDTWHYFLVADSRTFCETKTGWSMYVLHLWDIKDVVVKKVKKYEWRLHCMIWWKNRDVESLIPKI